MKLNHLHLMVTDVDVAVAFLERYFDLRTIYRPSSKLIAMQDDNESVITLMYAKEAVYPAHFHIGFVRENASGVDRIYQAMTAQGFEIDEPTETHHGYCFYVKMPGGPLVEVLG